MWTTVWGKSHCWGRVKALCNPNELTLTADLATEQPPGGLPLQMLNAEMQHPLQKELDTSSSFTVTGRFSAPCQSPSPAAHQEIPTGRGAPQKGGLLKASSTDTQLMVTDRRQKFGSRKIHVRSSRGQYPRFSRISQVLCSTEPGGVLK